MNASVRRTARKDWDTLTDELYGHVITGASFGIGLAAKSKGLLGSSLKLRLNQRFPSQQVTRFIKDNFKAKMLDRLFDSDQGLEAADRSNLYKVKAGDLGLPRNSLIYRVENSDDANLRAVLIFGGEWMAQQMDARLHAAAEILEGRTAAGKVDRALEDPESLMKELSRINVKRLFEYNLERLSQIVNGLEETKEQLPKDLKPIFKSVNDYVLKKRLRR